MSKIHSSSEWVLGDSKSAAKYLFEFFFFFEELRRRERVSEGQQIYFQFSRRKEGRFPRMAACTWILKLYLCEVLENTAKEMISEHFGKETTHP